MKKYLTGLKITVLALMLSLGVSFVFAQWTGPTASFPNDNVERPINVGSDLQTKAGSLWANFLGSDSGFYVQGNAEIGGTLTVGGGTPADGKVLTSQDGNGLATWSDFPSLDCQSVSNSTNDSEASVSCQPTEIVTGGGGDCGSEKINYSRPKNSPEGWELKCDESADITVYAVCCSSQLQVNNPGGGI